MKGRCNKGDLCGYAHGEDDIREESDGMTDEQFRKFIKFCKSQLKQTSHPQNQLGFNSDVDTLKQIKDDFKYDL